MSDYYGVSSSTESFLAHYGVRGMKWGVRKMIDRQGSSGTQSHSKSYADAEKKLRRATRVGGVVGGLAYAAKHKNDFKSNNSKGEVKKSSPNKVSSKSNKTKDDMDRGLNKKQRELRRQWAEAGKKRQEALERRNKSFLGSLGYGKHQKAYEEADNANTKAAGAFWDSMSEKQRKRYHDRYFY